MYILIDADKKNKQKWPEQNSMSDHDSKDIRFGLRYSGHARNQSWLERNDMRFVAKTLYFLSTVLGWEIEERSYCTRSSHKRKGHQASFNTYTMSNDIQNIKDYYATEGKKKEKEISRKDRRFNNRDPQPNYYVMAGRYTAKKNTKKQQQKHRERDIEANRIQAGDADLFKRLRAMEDKLQRRGITAIVFMLLCIVLSIWLIPKQYIRHTTVGITSTSVSLNMEGLWNKYKSGSVILFDRGSCTLPVSVFSSSTSWVKSGRSHKIFRADGTLLLSLDCRYQYDTMNGKCSVEEESICNQ